MRACLIIIFSYVISISVNASNICESFVKEGKDAAYLQIDSRLCAFDITAIDSLEYLDSHTSLVPQFGTTTVLIGHGEVYAVLADLESKANRLMSTNNGVHSNFIVSAVAWCAVTPWCASLVASAVISAGRWVAGAAAGGVVGGYTWYKTQKYLTDTEDHHCPDHRR